ncbi:hypothetical protein ACHAPV_000122 [Trichoderma viride]
MSVQAESPGKAPPDLRIADITGPKGYWTSKDFPEGSFNHTDALLCLGMYRKQVMLLDPSQRREIIDIITKGRFLRSEKAKYYPENHSLYRSIQDKKFAAEHLSWPSYIILRALYQSFVPLAYVGHIERKFGTAVIGNFSGAFFKHYPQERAMITIFFKNSGPPEAAKFDETVLAPVGDQLGMEQGALKRFFDSYKTTENEKGAEDDDLPASKRPKTSHKPNTQNTPSTTQQRPKVATEGQTSKNKPKYNSTCAKEAPQTQNFTIESSGVATVEVILPVNPDICDIQGQPLSKTSQNNCQAADNAASSAAKRSQQEDFESRLKALEESHRVLISKLDITTAAFEAINTTIETIITEVRADREGCNHVLSSIKDVMRGVADSINVKE